MQHDSNPPMTPENRIGPYSVINLIGKGGMGEVFLVHDPICERNIALKRIRPDLLEHPQIRHRFLKEARLTCQLTHPAIIPIYTIYSTNDSVFYTMPFIEGDTLKQILRNNRQLEKNGEKLDHLGGSIPALMHIFITICQAVAYAHSKRILHRDLKPENVIVGKYGEVLILDWGLAKIIGQPADEMAESTSTSDGFATRIGKVVGTIAYMAPERALGMPATIQSDIYSLGVILYQLLALKSPFRRKSLEEFRKMVNDEVLVDPMIASPHREIPKALAESALKCLSKDPKERYSSVDDLINDLQNFLEGHSEWFHSANLTTSTKKDWEFQENILLSDHTAITRSTEEAEWVSLMISRHSFAGNTKIETSVLLKENSRGIGFLFSVPEASQRIHINEGYCLWIGSDKYRTTKLLRDNAEVMHAPDIFIKREEWMKIRIEKIEKSIHLYINDTLQLSYLSHLPLIGTHIGLMSRDADYEIKPLQIFVGNLNLTVNCLAVPDAFLAHGDFNQALSEYRRIAYSFPDRSEGREALFRSGLTFIEQAKSEGNKQEFLDKALTEFEKLHNTPGAPLSYLGKAQVYEIVNENEEEVKCFELAYRRYPRHPLLAIIQEQILSRMHEVSRLHRLATYRFMLLSARHFPQSTLDTHTKRLFTSLQKHWEILPFIEETEDKGDPFEPSRLTIPLAFWLAKPYTLGEIIDELLREPTQKSEIGIANAFFTLFELGAHAYAKFKFDQVIEKLPQIPKIKWLTHDFNHYTHPENTHVSFDELRAILCYLDLALDQNETHLIHQLAKTLEHIELTFDSRLKLNTRLIWAFLLEKNWQQAGEIFYAYPVEILNKDSTLLHFLYGCWLQATEGAEIALIHFTGLLSVTFPRTWTLASHYLIGQLPPEGSWFTQAFFWEKQQLYRQLTLYYHCAGDEDNKLKFKALYEQQVMHVEP